MSLLEVRGISKHFGGLYALNSLEFSVEQGEIVSVIGPNGAGKSTLFNVITGLYHADAGDIIFRGESIVGLTPNQITRLGIARTFQTVHLFPNMTVLENAMVGQHCRSKAGVLGAIFQSRRQRAEEQRIREGAQEALNFFGTKLTGYRQDQPAFVLSYANRRRLEMARAMATEPMILLLDEPTAGMNPHETLVLRDQIVRMRDERGLTIVVIEHDMRVVKGVSDRVVACDYGQKIAEGLLRGGRERRARDRGLPGHEGGRVSGEAPAPVAPPDADPDRRPALELRDVSTHYGLVSVLRNVNVQIFPGEMVCLLGGNASGKTTTLKTILGYVTPSEGEVLLDGHVISGLRTKEVVARGVSMVPENRRLFPHMTVAENLDIGAYLRTDRAKVAEDREQVLQTFPRVRERLKQKAGTLSGGEQQMVAMCRALMADPRVLLMDEPSMGLAPVLVEQVFQIIKTIRDLGRTIFVVEQNANMALSIADRGYVLQTGEIVLAGAATALLENPRMREAYLGEL